MLNLSLKSCRRITQYINWREVQRKTVANNVDRVKFKGTMTKWPVQKQTLRTARNMQNNMAQQTFEKKLFIL